ncbi:hypothetical protein ACNRBV_04030 [Ralstonia pseudosolanacearum]|uniref:hypothetical protein n=1 Tax=Ralstonia pseudosolanacearum TaxID=1310165 RepID=UPI0018A40A74|nr:hypothetical protein [Ralstonia pseudosolanacearum]BCL93370.1 hypothetical protein MAFF211479_30710 [Ralstonia solanacearum]BCN05937.1 hypothetical protein RPSB_30740 [Ralstonia solanacearum]
MDTSNLKSQLEAALSAKLSEMVTQFQGKVVRRLDIGVFPWHGTLELSVLLADDVCEERDIASWPNYDVSRLSGGEWPEAVECCKEMQHQWVSNTALTTSFLELVGEVVRSQDVRASIDSMKRSDDFVVTVLDPDNRNSPNYAARGASP